MPAGDPDLLDDEAEKPLPLLEVEAVHALGHARGEVRDPLAQPVARGELVALRRELGLLPLELASPRIDLCETAREIAHLDEAGLVHVGHAPPLGHGLVDATGEPGQLRAEDLIVGGGCALGDGLLALEQSVGSQHELTHAGEHERVQLVGADAALAADLVRTAGPEGLVVRAGVVPVPLLPALGRGAHLLGVSLDAARTAHDQATQQPRARRRAARAEHRVVPLHALRGLEGLLGEDRGHGHADPVLRVAGCLPPAALPGQRRGHRLPAEPFGRAHVGAVADQPAQGGVSPHRPAGGREDVALEQPARDLAQRAAGRDVVIEDLPDDGRFGFVDLQARRAVGGARNTTIPVGDLPEDGLAGSGAIQLAAAVTLADLGPLVLGDDALHLGEQACLRVVVDVRRVGEAHLTAHAVKLVHDEHLVGVRAGQAVGREAPHGLKQTRLGRVAQRVQPRAVQACARAAVVQKLGHDLVTLRGHARSQRVDLRVDRAPGLLRVA